MSKADDLLEFCKKNLNRWTCSMCGSHSGQPAAIFRVLKNAGWKFEEVAPQRWAKTCYCPKCCQETTHYKLISLTQGEDKSRIGFQKKDRDRIISVLGDTDAFTGASVKSSLEIDHKIPFDRLKENGGDINVAFLNNNEIAQHFQILTRDHNLLKDRACQKCIKSGRRPPFLGINFWYEGDEQYKGSCVGCGWYDGCEWRKRLNRLLK